LGDAYLAAGRVADALGQSTRALDLALEHRGRGDQAWALRLRAEVFSRRDIPDVLQAEDLYRQARVLAEELGMRPLAAQCHFGLGKLYDRIGKRTAAEESVLKASAVYRRLDMRSWLDRAEAARNQFP
jgi:tetratricopeptide (TPR) repeat protein